MCLEIIQKLKFFSFFFFLKKSKMNSLFWLNYYLNLLIKNFLIVLLSFYGHNMYNYSSSFKFD